ncbi:MAG: ATP-binding protein [Desulfobacterales bacterium]|nr:ATP-binding protein [Desulfobacterales bacterium]
MKEIVCISGKGGTGKTSLTAAFSHLAENKMICDLDVDAPDLHLILKPRIEATEEFYSGNEAIIDPDRCEGCGQCAELCRFGAISQSGEVYEIDPLRCEGCKLCVVMCPEEAIDFPPRHCGQWFRSESRFGSVFHAQLFPGEENSGRLVALLRQEARQAAEKKRYSLVLADGAPGIGCPVIASLSGADLAVIISEPTVSGRHDLERVADLCAYFGMPATVVINKADLNEDACLDIESFCRKRGLDLLGRVPHDQLFVEAMIQEKAVTELEDAALSDRIREIWSAIEIRAGLNEQKTQETITLKEE